MRWGYAMTLRISGTREECAATVAAVSAALAVREVSDLYPNRGVIVLGRVHLDAEAPGGAVRAGAERTDRTVRSCWVTPSSDDPVRLPRLRVVLSAAWLSEVRRSW